jgi:ParB family chromosome partitioning protein
MVDQVEELVLQVAEGQQVAMIPVHLIFPNPDQPRKNFDEESLQSLADSVKEHGVLQAITVRGPFPDDGHYWLIAGERRLRAAKMAGLATIPAVIRAADEETNTSESLELAMIENLQREDMSPADEGNSYKRLREECGYTVNHICRLVNRSVATVNAKLAIANMEPEIQRYYVRGGLPSDYVAVRAIANLPDDKRVKVACSLGARNASRGAVLRVCATIMRGFSDQKAHVKRRPSASPSVSYVDKPDNRLYAVLKKQGVVPEWNMLEAAARETCVNCAIADTATDSICSECPATELVKRLCKKITEVN